MLGPYDEHSMPYFHNEGYSRAPVFLPPSPNVQVQLAAKGRVIALILFCTLGFNRVRGNGKKKKLAEKSVFYYRYI